MLNLFELNLKIFHQTSKLLFNISKFQCLNDLNSSELEILRDFYLQIAKQPLKFTTAGYFTINLQFFAEIFTGIAAYEGIHLF